MSSVRLFAIAVLACMATIASVHHADAARQKMIQYSSGTGFFISPYGYLITNEHVIRHCKDKNSIELKGAINGTARLVDTDAGHDLALLRADSNAPSAGKLLNAERYIQEGDKVMVMGYPLNAAQNGQYKVAMAEVLGTQGPTGEPHWLQFSDAAQKGNSGGPLLDRSGNVIGVVTGKTETFLTNTSTGRQESLGTSDVAVTLPILKRFLDKNRIRYNRGTTQVIRSDRYVEQTAQRFILNVRCVTGEGYM